MTCILSCVLYHLSYFKLTNIELGYVPKLRERVGIGSLTTQE